MIGLLGVAVLALALAGRHASPAIAKYRLLVTLIGIVLLLSWLVPRMAQGYVDAFRTGQRIRAEQGR